jgi:hypothetical protein
LLIQLRRSRIKRFSVFGADSARANIVSIAGTGTEQK